MFFVITGRDLDDRRLYFGVMEGSTVQVSICMGVLAVDSRLRVRQPSSFLDTSTSRNEILPFLPCSMVNLMPR